MRPIQITDVRVVPGDSAFLIDDGTTAVLYDAGFAFTGTAIAENIRKALGERKLAYILLSHSHYDHVLAVPYIKRIYPDAKVVAGRHAGEVFQKPTARAVMRQLNEKAAAKYGAAQWEDLIDELQVDMTVEDGDEITCNDLHFTAISLPGHTRCAMGYYLEENKLLLGAETLGVYFGGQTYLPSFLVGYQLTLDSFQKARALGAEGILLPHYGPVGQTDMERYLDRSQEATRQTAERILEMLQSGKTEEEILAVCKEEDYRENVSPIYPIDAFILNTKIMIEQTKKELL